MYDQFRHKSQKLELPDSGLGTDGVFFWGILKTISYKIRMEQ